MNWIIASLLMIVSSVALYLCIRQSNALKTPRQLNNLAMFLIPVLVYLLLTVRTPTSFTLRPFEYLLILVSAIFFAYLGNVFSLKGMEYSSNPGYRPTAFSPNFTPQRPSKSMFCSVLLIVDIIY